MSGHGWRLAVVAAALVGGGCSDVQLHGWGSTVVADAEADATSSSIDAAPPADATAPTPDVPGEVEGIDGGGDGPDVVAVDAVDGAADVLVAPDAGLGEDIADVADASTDSASADDAAGVGAGSDLIDGDAGPAQPCVPSCTWQACGSDGCDGSCGTCDAALSCVAGACQAEAPVDGPLPALIPGVIDFGVGEPGEVLKVGLGLVNLGLAPFDVLGFTVSGSPDLALVVEGQPFAAAAGSELHAELPAPWTLGPGGSVSLAVRYTPVDAGAVSASVEWVTDVAGEQPTLTMLGGSPEVCADVTPVALDFGATLVGDAATDDVELSSCGALPVTVTTLTIEPSDGPFAIDALPEALTIAPGGLATVAVTYQPGAPSAGDAATLTISTASGPLGDVALSGFAVEEACPVAVATALEGPLLNPGTILHLDGSQSYAAGSDVAAWSWSVNQPAGSVSGFHPSASLAKPTFACDVIGDYAFELEVMDLDGEPSCDTASVDLQVVPAQVLHIELLWDTPGDPDPSDEGFGLGADVDLHLLHPDADGDDVTGDGVPDGWFDPLWDCNWTNPDPVWGDGGAQDDDPHVLRLDFDGAGPESIALDVLADGATYRIGVHYRNQYAYGPSTARVRVFLFGALAWESPPVTLQMFDLWEVATLTWLGWPDAEITALDDGAGQPLVWPGVLP